MSTPFLVYGYLTCYLLLNVLKSPLKMNIPALRFLDEVRTETLKVTWPTRNQVIKLTIIVIAVSILVALYVFALDLSFEQVIKFLVVR